MTSIAVVRQERQLLDRGSRSGTAVLRSPPSCRSRSPADRRPRAPPRRRTPRRNPTATSQRVPNGASGSAYMSRVLFCGTEWAPSPHAHRTRAGDRHLVAHRTGRSARATRRTWPSCSRSTARSTSTSPSRCSSVAARRTLRSRFSSQRRGGNHVSLTSPRRLRRAPVGLSWPPGRRSRPPAAGCSRNAGRALGSGASARLRRAAGLPCAARQLAGLQAPAPVVVVDLAGGCSSAPRCLARASWAGTIARSAHGRQRTLDQRPRVALAAAAGPAVSWVEGVDDLVSVVVEAVGVVGQPSERPDEGRPSREVEVVTEGMHVRRDHADVLRDHRQGPEIRLGGAEARPPARRPPACRVPTRRSPGPSSRRRSRESGRSDRGRRSRARRASGRSTSGSRCGPSPPSRKSGSPQSCPRALRSSGGAPAATSSRGGTGRGARRGRTAGRDVDRTSPWPYAPRG